MTTVIAVVVTRNRRELLRESLSAVSGQTRPVDRIVVVDNASTDGTPEMLRDEFADALVVALPVNQGGAGGFYEGIAAACSEGADWLWLLDDDSFPRPNALAELLAALERLDGDPKPALLASRVEWQDGDPHPMNMPTVRRRDPQLLVEAVRMGYLPLRATTFVSLLLAREATEREGMPRRDFFWQADDIEYTARILRQERGYFVPGSVVEHRTPSKQTGTSDERRFYHHVRNTVLILRGDAWASWEKPALAWSLVGSIVEHLRLNRFAPASVWTVVRGLGAGLSRPGG
jgi:rhamnopyranosyl-N-acetylglucosaminyl-diphospho-decaprenol beta-1,3/1,4-galactofuranosyltransferase